MAAVKKDGTAIQYSTLCADPEITCAAIQNTPHALSFVDSSLDNNNQFIECIIKHKVKSIKRPELQRHIKDRLSLKMVEKELSDSIKHAVNSYL